MYNSYDVLAEKRRIVDYYDAYQAHAELPMMIISLDACKKVFTVNDNQYMYKSYDLLAAKWRSVDYIAFKSNMWKELMVALKRQAYF